ncbi:Serine/threonine-protein kinase sepA [Durusdinium trenchii]|uniref:Serine/threonine-protein kinase sepA n=1 Tax=Durusdinium trenchii TaxID=1381693 RepID=A0ABP0J8I7_9DINO
MYGAGSADGSQHVGPDAHVRGHDAVGTDWLDPTSDTDHCDCAFGVCFDAALSAGDLEIGWCDLLFLAGRCHSFLDPSTGGFMCIARCVQSATDWSTEVAAAYEKCLKDAACFRLRTCVTNVFLFAFELLLVLQLEGTLNDSWFMVMCPWIALEIWWLLHRLYYSRVAWTLADPEAAVATENEAWKLLTSSSFWCFFVSFLQRGALRLLTCILIAVRADSTGGSWFAVFVPLYISSVLAVVFACIVKKKQPFLHADDEEEQGTAAPTCCLSCIWLAMLFLAAGKLDGGTYSAAWIFSPIFFFMSLAVCLLSVGISVAQPQHFAHAADIMGEPIGKPTE